VSTGQTVADRSQVAIAAWALSLLLLTTGTWHFLAPAGFESIVPGFLGSPALWVALSGAAELACAAALTVPSTRRFGGWACAALFVIVYPANVTMALQSLRGHGSVPIAWLRLPLQIPLILLAVYIGRRAGTAKAKMNRVTTTEA
jgi:uncharacterized membrane protein